MDTNGNLHWLTEDQRKEYEQVNREKLMSLTEEEYKQLSPLTKKKRKNRMRNHLCPCGSGKKFKKCCW